MLCHVINIPFSAYPNGYHFLICFSRVVRVSLDAYIHQLVVAVIGRDNNSGQQLGHEIVGYGRTRSCSIAYA